MATEQGLVIRTAGGRAWVKTLRTSACEHCSVKEGCHTLGGGKEVEVEALNSIGAKEGDTVIIGFPSGSLLKVTFLVYIFPIIAMMVGAGLGLNFARERGFDSSTASVAGAFLFFFTAFFIVRVFGGKLGKNRKYYSRIIRIVRNIKTKHESAADGFQKDSTEIRCKT